VMTANTFDFLQGNGPTVLRMLGATDQLLQKVSVAFSTVLLWDAVSCCEITSLLTCTGGL
jgi:hypothetical protein